MLIVFFVIVCFLTYKELKKEGKLTTYEELGMSKPQEACEIRTVTITGDEDGNAEVIEDDVLFHND